MFQEMKYAHCSMNKQHIKRGDKKDKNSYMNSLGIHSLEELHFNAEVKDNVFTEWCDKACLLFNEQ